MKSSGLAVAEVDSMGGALQLLRREQFDVVVTDLRLVDSNGIELIRKARSFCRAPWILVTGYATLSTAMDAARLGAFDVLAKPVDADELVRGIHRAAINRALPAPDRMVGSSAQMDHIRRVIARIAPTKIPVLLEGESGTGKELVARELHDQSGHSGSFIAVNCAALTDSLVESELFGHVKGAFTGSDYARQGFIRTAHLGTLLLDEVCSLSLGTQAKLLRVLDAGELRPLGEDSCRQVDVRVVAATNSDLRQLVQRSRFRQDLYFRISAHHLHLPPLRARGGDREELIEYFLRSYPGTRLTADAKTALARYPFPGNVRELQYIIQNAAVLADGTLITEKDLRLDTLKPLGDSPQDNITRINTALLQAGGNHTAAARRLGISRTTLWRLLRRACTDETE